MRSFCFSWFVSAAPAMHANLLFRMGIACCSRLLIFCLTTRVSRNHTQVSSNSNAWERQQKSTRLDSCLVADAHCGRSYSSPLRQSTPSLYRRSRGQTTSRNEHNEASENGCTGRTCCLVNLVAWKSGKLVCFRQAPGCLSHFCAASLNPLGSSLQFSASSFPCTPRPSASTIESSASHTLTFLSGTRRSIDGLLGLRESRRGLFFDGPRWRITAPRNAQLVLHETPIQLRERTSEGMVENECSKLAPLSHCKNRRAAASQHKPSVCTQRSNLPTDVLRHVKLTQQTSTGVNVSSRRGQDRFRHVEVSESGADGFARTATLVVGGHAENGLPDDVVESFVEVNKDGRSRQATWCGRLVLCSSDSCSRIGWVGYRTALGSFF